MAVRVIKINKSVGEAIKNRRMELGYSIEDLAEKTNIGIKTLSKYENGDSIRVDKLKPLLKILKWDKLPGIEDELNTIENDFSPYCKSPNWSEYLKENYGKYAAISFVIGVENLLEFLEDDINYISCLPKNTHIGELEVSWLCYMLPEQFLMEYNYEFLYAMRCELRKLIMRLVHNDDFKVHTVIDELLIRLIVECSREEMEDVVDNDLDVFWDEWRFEICEDDDIDIFLYDKYFIDETNIYHFKNWFLKQFNTSEQD